MDEEQRFFIAPVAAVRAEGDAFDVTDFTFSVTRSGDTSGFATVDFEAGGTGASAADEEDFFGAVAGTLFFTAGETASTLTIRVRGDDAPEADETFAVTLSDPSDNGVIAAGTAEGAILDDDGGVPAATQFLAILPADAVKAEGDDFEITEFTFTVTRSGDTADEATVDYALAPAGPAPAGEDDFRGFETGTVRFGPGETVEDITIRVDGDGTPEPDESFAVMLANPSAGAAITGETATGLILNDDAARALTIRPLDAVKPEGDEDAVTEFTFTVLRAGDVTGQTTVRFAAAGTSFDQASDRDFFGTPSGSVLIGTGETSATITIRIAGDDEAEANETFQVTLSDAGGDAVIAGATAEGIILDDDGGTPAPPTGAGTVDVFRFFNTQAGGHFFTADAAERDLVRATLPHFEDEGVAFAALPADSTAAGATDVFRFFNTQAGGHFFTTDPAERDRIVETLPQLTFEGVGFDAFDSPVADTVPVYRFFNTQAGGHFFTSDPAERDLVLDTLPQFNFEGIGFYAFPDAIG
ncbi:MAG: hypothetical protein GVY13_09495 [Alphaproteobacteria bacterium]|jgi:hypothetical protein|nr:hypothetical protein [Alphaproteobacteria bacterium]